MNNLTRKQKEIGLIVLSSIFCLIMVAYAYFTFYVPKKESLAVAETTLTTDRQVLFALEQQFADQPNTPIVSSLELQKLVPIEPLTELVLLQLEKAEVVSQSEIQLVDFIEGPFLIEDPPEGVETLQELLVSITIEADAYSNLEVFIDELEKLDRILVVDSIEFSSMGEVTTVEQEKEKLILNLSFSAFYRPDLLELLDEGPKVDTPAPADKSNPLPSNEVIDDGEVVATEADAVNTNENESAEEATSEANTVLQAPVSQSTTKQVTQVATSESTKIAAETKNQTYTVKPGDTLFSISMQHYGTPQGIENIKVANDLPSNNVMVNETLIIPY